MPGRLVAVDAGDRAERGAEDRAEHQGGGEPHVGAQLARRSGGGRSSLGGTVSDISPRYGGGGASRHPPCGGSVARCRSRAIPQGGWPAAQARAWDGGVEPTGGPMTDRTYTVALIVGSVSEPSLNRRLANALVGLRRMPGSSSSTWRSATCPSSERSSSPRTTTPRSAAAFKKQVDAADGLLIVTPGIQPLDPRGAQERDRLALAPEGDELVPGAPDRRDGDERRSRLDGGRAEPPQGDPDLAGRARARGPEAYIQYEDGLIADDGTVPDADDPRFPARVPPRRSMT